MKEQVKFQDDIIDVGVKSLNYLLVFLLIGVSTIPIFRTSIGLYSVFGLCLFVWKKALSFSLSLLFLVLLIIIEIFHYCYFYPGYNFVDIRQQVFAFLVALIIVVQLKYKFIPVYIKIMYVITIISLIVYSVFLISSSLIDQFVSSMPDFFRLKYMTYGVSFTLVNPVFFCFGSHLFENFRNNGPFWEPTVFAGMLITGLIFNYLQFKTFLNKYGIIFIIGMLTTFSTTGYIALFILIFSIFILSQRIKLIIKISATISLIVLGLYIYNSLPFLSDKITSEYESVQDDAYNQGGNSRMASAYLDWEEITEKPIYFILGKGINLTNRIKGKDKNVLRNNGLTGLLVEEGIIFFVIYIFLLWFTFYWLCKKYRISVFFSFFFTLILLELSFSEIFFDLSFFESFTFLGLVLFEANKKKINA